MLILALVVYTFIEIFIIFKAFKNNKPIAIQSIVIYLMILALLFIMKMFKLNIPKYATILIILSALGHIFVGKFLNYYNKSRKYDRYLHAFGTFSFSIYTYSLILSIINPAVTSQILAGVFVFTIGLSYGLIFEILEFISDYKKKKKNIIKQKSQRGLMDTDFDMIFDIIGSFFAAIFSFFMLI